MFDMNDAELPRGSDLIPDGTFAKVTMVIRPGGVDGQGEIDRGLLKASRNGSDAKMIDAEFTVVSGPHTKRKFWQNFTVAGGKVDEHGVSIAWKISKGTFRAMIDSTLGLDPQDMGEAAKAKKKSALSVGVAASVSLGRMKSLRSAAFKAKEGAEANAEARRVACSWVVPDGKRSWICFRLSRASRGSAVSTWRLSERNRME